MFNKILIANRGEIACRVMKTARRLGIRTVAVYSEADAKSRHVRHADEAVLIGPAAARDSYLVISKIIEAAKATSSQAIHPGYGFLSENEEFCEACEAAGIVFIGPPVSAIRAMGSKSEAKKLMERARVPLTPGYHGDNQQPAYLHEQADHIGYPVLIKASAGGGGKGMRLVERSEDFRDSLESCQREASSSFGSDHVLVEKYITRPRHIEIQVFADTQGDCVYLFERDCSVQRRHQKVLEEAPAPGMSEERRQAMGKAAVEAAQAVGYVGAGTVEFIANQDGSFYFMEMNTRLQVEHPVTEMITGLDLVEWQLRVASGEPLPLKQEQLQIRGHAIEARIYAEDPSKGFLPSTGVLSHLSLPAETLHVRVDTGVEEGDAISPHYDPMIAKLIVWDQDRARALGRMQKALADYQVVGVANNIEFLSRLVICPAFSSADLDTGLIEREKVYLFPEQTDVPLAVWQCVALAEVLSEQQPSWASMEGDGDVESPWNRRDGWRLNADGQRHFLFRSEEVEQRIAVRYRGPHLLLEINGQSTVVSGGWGERGELIADLGGWRTSAVVIAAAEKRHVFLNGFTWILEKVDPLFRITDSHPAEGSLVAPMPGKVVAVLASCGQQVQQGAPLLILEAMKMEHTIAAPRNGIVKAFFYGAGDQVSDGAELLEFEVAEE